MPDVWKISGSSHKCFHSGQEIPPETPFYSALIENGAVFERRDYSLAAWAEVEKSLFFSFWKSRGWSHKNKPNNNIPLIDYPRLLAFYDELAGSEERHRRLFRYVVGLILSRKRILRLETVRKTPAGDCLEVYDRRSRETTLLNAPEASAAEMQAVQDQLNLLFESGEEEVELVASLPE
ncbi:MAG: hypothetical protein LBU79_00420 [Planctomycetota bacterium]|jgi:hypothetical protein|nr:hypothetical protein [Planctomycetota bacterium]